MGSSQQLLPIALTMGDPAGIGGEIALACRQNLSTRPVPEFFVIDDPQRLTGLASVLEMKTPIVEIDDPSQTFEAFKSGLPVLAVGTNVDATPGMADAGNAKAILDSIVRGLELVTAGSAGGLVTNPIHKAILYDAGFTYPGHTEYLANLVAADQHPVMMLICPGLRVVPVTIHMSLRQAIEDLTTDKIVANGKIVHRALIEDFGIPAPRLAVAALNPHAGEDTAMGAEETDIIAPAVALLSEAGIDARGPAPADTLFHSAARQNYDAALCMYHDQALIPLKTIDFMQGVNVTLGLPFVRTSPDHGTAFGLAGTGRADPSSLAAALDMAAEMAANRQASARMRNAGD